MKALSKPTEKPWNGYTYDELMYQRVLVKTRIEIEKYRLGNATESFRRDNALLNGSLLSRVFGAVSWVEYAVLAFRVFRRVRAAFGK